MHGSRALLNDKMQFGPITPGRRTVIRAINLVTRPDREIARIQVIRRVAYVNHGDITPISRMVHVDVRNSGSQRAIDTLPPTSIAHETDQSFRTFTVMAKKFCRDIDDYAY